MEKSKLVRFPTLQKEILRKIKGGNVAPADCKCTLSKNNGCIDGKGTP